MDQKLFTILVPKGDPFLIHFCLIYLFLGNGSGAKIDLSQTQIGSKIGSNTWSSIHLQLQVDQECVFHMTSTQMDQKTNPRKTIQFCNSLKIYSIILSVIFCIFVMIIFIISAHFSQIIMN